MQYCIVFSEEQFHLIVTVSVISTTTTNKPHDRNKFYFHHAARLFLHRVYFFMINEHVFDRFIFFARNKQFMFSIIIQSRLLRLNGTSVSNRILFDTDSFKKFTD